MIIYLYVKQHSVTSLKYFGKTVSKNPFKYKGSGSYWINHINKYGKQFINTLEVWGFDNQKDCTDFALKFSLANNIVESPEWANQIVENGLDGFIPGQSGYVWTDERRAERSAKYTGEGNPRYGSEVPEHKKMYGDHNPMYGKTFTDEWKITRSKKYTGEGNPNYGKPAWNRGKPGSYNHTDETKQILSGLAKNRSDSHKQKLKAALKAKPAWNKGLPPARIHCDVCSRDVDIRNFAKYHKHDGSVIKNPAPRCSCVRCRVETTIRAWPRHKCSGADGHQ